MDKMTISSWISAFLYITIILQLSGSVQVLSALNYESTSLHTISLRGSYSWKLVLDIDNKNNSGLIRKQVSLRSVMDARYVPLKRSLMEGNFKGANLNGSLFEVVNVVLSGDVNSELRTAYERLCEDEHSSTWREAVSDGMYEIGPHSTFKLYRLEFKGPGVTYMMDTVSSKNDALKDVQITFTLKQIPILKSIDVVYTDDSLRQPSDIMPMAQGANGDINKGFSGKYVWLVPRWTIDLREGITNVHITFQGHPIPNYNDLAMGTSGLRRYIVLHGDPRSDKRITRIGLYREIRQVGLDEIRSKGWDEMSININDGRNGTYLYLVWNTVTLDSFTIM